MRNLLSFVRFLSGLLVLVLVAILAYWAMQLAAPRPAVAPSGTLGDAATSRNLSSAARAFGTPQAAQPVQAAPTNIQVFGVAESGENGVVILAVDGKPAQAVAVGTQVNRSTRLLSALDGKVVLEHNGRRIEVNAPERPSLAILTSGVGKPRDSSQATTAPVPTRPGGFNLPPRGVPPQQPPVPPAPAVTPPPLAPPAQPPEAQAPPGQPPGQQPPAFQAQDLPPPNPVATQPAYPPQFESPQFDPQTGQSSQGILAPNVASPNQTPGNPALNQ